jgi:hypothetical protein
VESTSAITWHLRGTGTRSARRSLAGVGTKSASQSLVEAGTTEATVTRVKVATEARVINTENAENLRVEAKDHIDPLADLLPHHPVAEVEAEAGDLAPARSPLAAAHVTQGNASTSTDLTTLAQNALAR